jgi:hypothetical protein
MKWKPRYTLTALLAAILLIGLPLAWVRHQLDKRAAYRKQLYDDFVEQGVYVHYHFGLPKHPRYGYFEDVKNPNQLKGIAFSGPDFDDDELHRFDVLPNLEEIEMYETHVTDAGLLYLAWQHPHLTKVKVTSHIITKDGVARFRLARPGVQVFADVHGRRSPELPEIFGATYDPVNVP